MKTIQRRSYRWLQSTLICIFGLMVIAQTGLGQYVFFDTFDSQSVGDFPSPWTNVLTPPTGAFYVTNNIPGTPSTPNVAGLANLTTSTTYNVRRDFPNTPLNVVSQFVFSYRLNVASITNNQSFGFVILPAGAISQGEETFAEIRVLSGSSAGTWSVLNPNYLNNGGPQTITNNLSLNTWHDFRFEVDPSSTNARNGVVRWYMDSQLINTENFLTPDLPRTNISALVVRDIDVAFPGYFAINTFYLDNVYAFTEIPEPGALPLAFLGIGVVAAVRRRMR